MNTRTAITSAFKFIATILLVAAPSLAFAQFGDGSIGTWGDGDLGGSSLSSDPFNPFNTNLQNIMGVGDLLNGGSGLSGGGLGLDGGMGLGGLGIGGIVGITGSNLGAFGSLDLGSTLNNSSLNNSTLGGFSLGGLSGTQTQGGTNGNGGLSGVTQSGNSIQSSGAIGTTNLGQSPSTNGGSSQGGGTSVVGGSSQSGFMGSSVDDLDVGGDQTSVLFPDGTSLDIIPQGNNHVLVFRDSQGKVSSQSSVGSNANVFMNGHAINLSGGGVTVDNVSVSNALQSGGSGGQQSDAPPTGTAQDQSFLGMVGSVISFLSPVSSANAAPSRIFVLRADGTVRLIDPSRKQAGDTEVSQKEADSLQQLGIDDRQAALQKDRAKSAAFFLQNPHLIPDSPTASNPKGIQGGVINDPNAGAFRAMTDEDTIVQMPNGDVVINPKQGLSAALAAGGTQLTKNQVRDMNKGVLPNIDKLGNETTFRPAQSVSDKPTDLTTNNRQGGVIGTGVGSILGGGININTQQNTGTASNNNDSGLTRGILPSSPNNASVVGPQSSLLNWTAPLGGGFATQDQPQPNQDSGQQFASFQADKNLANDVTAPDDTPELLNVGIFNQRASDNLSKFLQSSEPTKPTANINGANVAIDSIRPIQDTLSFGTGDPDQVRALQLALQKAGFFPGVINGNFDINTRNAVESFQRANRLLDAGTTESAGIVGINTLVAINGIIEVIAEDVSAAPRGQNALGNSLSPNISFPKNQDRFLNTGNNGEIVRSAPQITTTPLIPAPSNPQQIQQFDVFNVGSSITGESQTRGVPGTTFVQPFGQAPTLQGSFDSRFQAIGGGLIPQQANPVPSPSSVAPQVLPGNSPSQSNFFGTPFFGTPQPFIQPQRPMSAPVTVGPLLEFVAAYSQEFDANMAAVATAITFTPVEILIDALSDLFVMAGIY